MYFEGRTTKYLLGSRGLIQGPKEHLVAYTSRPGQLGEWCCHVLRRRTQELQYLVGRIKAWLDRKTGWKKRVSRWARWAELKEIRTDPEVYDT